MAKTRTIFVCQQCGSQQTRWMGKCPDCGTWDSLVEQVEQRATGSVRARNNAPGDATSRAVPLRDVSVGGFERLPVLGSEFQRVLGGGLVPGSLVLIGGDPGIGKCLGGSSRVLDPVSGAFLPITKWSEKSRPVLSLDQETYHLAAQQVSAFHDQGVRPVVDVTTRLGRILRCTPSHPMLTPEGWRAVSELEPGTRIAAPRALPYFGNEALAEAEVKLIAYTLSDGSAHDSISVTSALPEVEHDVASIAAHFGMTVRTYTKANNRAKQYRFVVSWNEREKARAEIAAALKQVQGATGLSWASWARAANVNYAVLYTWRRGEAAPSIEELQRLADSAEVPLENLAPTARDRAQMTNPVARFLERVGLRGATAATKAMPDAVFRLPRTQMVLFLQVLFSCDGSVFVNENGLAGISYSTISRRLAEDVQHLLLRFGFVSRLRTKSQRVNNEPYTAYEIQLLGVQEVKRFISEIGIWGRERAKARLAQLVSRELSSTQFDTVLTGAAFWEHLRDLTGEISLRIVSQQAGVTLCNRRYERPLCRSTVAAIANVYLSQHLDKLARSDVYWDEIASITPAGEERVYDLTVPDAANFVANDLILHNSTILLEAAAKFADTVGPALYISAEESAQQLKLRASRLNLDPEHLLVYSETSLDMALAQINEIRPRLVIVDSIQTVYLEDVNSAAGSVSQVREGALRLLRLAKETGIPMFLVGHVTKEGAIAGPRVLEHIVDAVLYLEGDRFHQYRLLRGVKNRFGSTNEVGVFEMTGDGMVEVPNPSQAFLAERSGGAPGSTVAVTLEGTRPLLVEVQALTSNTANPQPRRTANGFDTNRLLMLTAVLSKRVGVPLFNQDIYVNVVGGMRIGEPAADLAVTMAILSSYRNQRIDPDLVLVGEIGLSGELRSVSQIERRLGEAAKLGFRSAIYGGSAAPTPEGFQATTVRSLTEAVDLVLGRAAQGSGREDQP